MPWTRAGGDQQPAARRDRAQQRADAEADRARWRTLAGGRTGRRASRRRAAATTSVSRYASTTHCCSARPPWRLARIAGSATLTIVPSRNTIPEPRMLAVSAMSLRAHRARDPVSRPREHGVRLVPVEADAAARTACWSSRPRSTCAVARRSGRTSGRCSPARSRTCSRTRGYAGTQPGRGRRCTPARGRSRRSRAHAMRDHRRVDEQGPRRAARPRPPATTTVPP